MARRHPPPLTIRIRRFEPGDREAIRRLNGRLRDGGAALEVYGESGDARPPGPIQERLFVAADGDEVRGAVWLKEHDFRVRGADVRCGWLKYPVAESLVDQRFSAVPGSLLLQCLREQPRLLALGLGGHDTPLARMLARLKWTGTTVPFLVRVVRAGPVLRELEVLQRTPARRLAARALAATGAAQLGVFLLGAAVRAAGPPVGRGCAAEPVAGFDSWADDVWMACRDAYGFHAARSRALLAAMYPEGMRDTQRLRVTRRGRLIGWAVTVRHDFAVGAADPNFGRLKVGVLADALALPGDAPDVVAVAERALRDAGVDLVVSNQAHPVWVGALRGLGYLVGHSNFAFYRAPGAERLVAGDGPGGAAHVNRGDCDGPIWYA